MLSYITTPVQQIHDTLFEEKQVEVFVKREDMNHPHISGNKWWKLKYNLEEALKQNHDTLLTFGGAHSNHIYASAAAAKECGFKSIGIIRGEENLPLNPTLSFATSCGMHLHYVSREAYKRKTERDFIKELQKLYGRFYMIPEGGTNILAVQGVAEFAASLINAIEFDYCCLPVGTGGTISGMINGFNESKKVFGFSVLKGGEFLNDEIKKYSLQQHHKPWLLITDYHFGGYAKLDKVLLEFMERFKQTHNISLDFIYTAKMMYGVYDLIRKGSFKAKSKILCIHTGGLQGNTSAHS